VGAMITTVLAILVLVPIFASLGHPSVEDSRPGR